MIKIGNIHMILIVFHKQISAFITYITSSCFKIRNEIVWYQIVGDIQLQKKHVRFFKILLCKMLPFSNFLEIKLMVKI